MVSDIRVNSLLTISSPLGEDIAFLPKELINIFIEKIAEISKSAYELRRQVHIFVNIFESNVKNTIDSAFVQDKLFFAAIHACNEGVLAPKDFSINTYDKLIIFLTNSNGLLQKLDYGYVGEPLQEKQALELNRLCPLLKKVSLPCSTPDDATLMALIGDKQLSSLKIMGNKITTLAISEIARHPLEELEITFPTNLTDDDIQTLKSIKTLKHLKIIYSKKQQDRSIDIKRSCCIPR